MSEPELSNIIPILFQQVPPRLSHVCHQGAVTINYFPEGHPSRPSSFFKFPNIGQGYNSHEPVWHTPWANVDDMQRECAQVHQYHARARARAHGARLAAGAAAPVRRPRRSARSVAAE